MMVDGRRVQNNSRSSNEDDVLITITMSSHAFLLIYFYVLVFVSCYQERNPIKYRACLVYGGKGLAMIEEVGPEESVGSK